MLYLIFLWTFSPIVFFLFLNFQFALPCLLSFFWTFSLLYLAVVFIFLSYLHILIHLRFSELLFCSSLLSAYFSELLILPYSFSELSISSFLFFWTLIFCVPCHLSSTGWRPGWVVPKLRGISAPTFHTSPSL